MANKVVVAHLFNDFSGSPLVLSQIIEGFVKGGKKVDLYTSKHSGEGFLSNLDGVDEYTYSYKWHPNKWITLMRFMLAQVGLFFKLFRYRKEDVVVYVNTILPFGAALAGKILGKRVIYHIHETSVKPAIFKKFLIGMVGFCSSENAFVSNFLQKEEQVKGVSDVVIYNALSKTFLNKVEWSEKDREDAFRVLMLCSMKEYKGVWQFVRLAESLPSLKFELVLNALEDEVKDYFKEYNRPENLVIHPVQSNVHPFYKRASLVMNLSLPDQWVETFGMTAIEAYAYSIPFIAPPVGGIVEVVEEGKTGYLIDSRNEKELTEKVRKISEDKELYKSLQMNTKEALAKFSVDQLQEQTLALVEKM